MEDKAYLYIDKDFDVRMHSAKGEKHFSCFAEKQKKGGFSKLFGSWNRKFLFLNVDQKNLYYSSGPNSGSSKLISLNVLAVVIRRWNR